MGPNKHPYTSKANLSQVQEPQGTIPPQPEQCLPETGPQEPFRHESVQQAQCRGTCSSPGPTDKFAESHNAEFCCVATSESDADHLSSLDHPASHPVQFSGSSTADARDGVGCCDSEAQHTVSAPQREAVVSDGFQEMNREAEGVMEVQEQVLDRAQFTVAWEASKESQGDQEGCDLCGSSGEVQRLTDQLRRKDEQLDIAIGQLWGALDEIEALRHSPGANGGPGAHVAEEGEQGVHDVPAPPSAVVQRVHERLNRALQGMGKLQHSALAFFDHPAAALQHSREHEGLVAQHACRTPAARGATVADARTPELSYDSRRGAQSARCAVVTEQVAWDVGHGVGSPAAASTHSCSGSNSCNQIAPQENTAANSGSNVKLAALVPQGGTSAAPPLVTWEVPEWNVPSGAATGHGTPPAAEVTLRHSDSHASLYDSSPVEGDPRSMSPLPFCAPMLPSPAPAQLPSRPVRNPQNPQHLTGGSLHSPVLCEGRATSPSQHTRNPRDHSLPASPDPGDGTDHLRNRFTSTCSVLEDHSAASHQLCTENQCTSGLGTQVTQQGVADTVPCMHHQVIATQTAPDSASACSCCSSSPRSIQCRPVVVHVAHAPSACAMIPGKHEPTHWQSLHANPPAHLSSGARNHQLLYQGCCCQGARSVAQLVPCAGLPGCALCGSQSPLCSISSSRELRLAVESHEASCMQRLRAHGSTPRDGVVAEGCLSPAAAQLLDPPPVCSPTALSNACSPCVLPFVEPGITALGPCGRSPDQALIHARHACGSATSPLDTSGAPLQFQYVERWPSGPRTGSKALVLRSGGFGLTSPGSLAARSMPAHMHRWAPPSFQAAMPPLAPRVNASPGHVTAYSPRRPRPPSPGTWSGSPVVDVEGLHTPPPASLSSWKGGPLSPHQSSAAARCSAHGQDAFGSFMGPQISSSSRRSAGSFLH